MDRREFTKGILATVTSFDLMAPLFDIASSYAAFNSQQPDYKPIESILPLLL